MKKYKLASFASALLLLSASGISAKAPDTWDGLLKVRARHFDAAYLLPNADFRVYTKIMIDRPEMAFRKNWQRDQARRVHDEDVRRTIDESSASFSNILANAYRGAGYEIVTQAGPDVLRLSTAVINLSINAPDQMTAGRTRSYAPEAGEGTLVIEVKDSVSGEVLGRVVDRRLAGSGGSSLRNSMTNRSDFERLFRDWARQSVSGLAELKANSPISPNGQRRK